MADFPAAVRIPLSEAGTDFDGARLAAARSLSSASALLLLYEECVLEDIMAKKGPRQLVRMRSTESHHVYLTSKNRRNDDKRLEHLCVSGMRPYSRRWQ